MCLGLLLQCSCCCGKTVCNGICKSVKGCCKMSIRQQVRLSYVFLSMISVLVLIFIMYKVPSTLGMWSNWIHCPQESGGDLVCLGISAIYRLSLTLAGLYILLLVCCLCRNNFSRLVNENFWFFKVAYIIGVFITYMYVSNDFFMSYSVIAKWVGICFLVFQLGMIIDLSYIIGEKLARLYDMNYQGMGAVLIGLSILIYISLTLINVKMFTWFPCHTQTNVFNIILIVGFTALSISGISPSGSLITSGLVGIYQTFLLWVALSNEDQQDCNQWYKDQNVMKIDVGFGSIFIFAALLYITLQDASQTTTQGYGNNILDNGANKESDEDDRDFIENIDQDSDSDEEKSGGDKDTGKSDKEMKKINESQIRNIYKQEKEKEKQAKIYKRMKDYQTNSYICFHFVMILSSVYFAMILTNWSTPKFINRIWQAYQPSDESRWINLIFSWLTSVLYVWSLIAPKIFPNRAFN